MTNILDKITAAKRERIENKKRLLSFTELEEHAARHSRLHISFAESLAENGISVIAEVKRASPSKGIICHDFQPELIARQYEAAGAACLSVLTEEDFFLGSDAYLQSILKMTKLPVLRKDFIIDAWQITQSAAMGTDAILLITALLDNSMMTDFLQQAEAYKLDCLTEVHNEVELEIALQSGAKIIGINNRDLTDFSVSLKTTKRLAALVPENCLLVSESGIRNRDDVEYILEAGADAVLIGEGLLKSGDIQGKIQELFGSGRM